jgi:putative transposase
MPWLLAAMATADPHLSAEASRNLPWQVGCGCTRRGGGVRRRHRTLLSLSARGAVEEQGNQANIGAHQPRVIAAPGCVEQTYYRWLKEYGGLKVDQARRLKELEQENAKLKRLVSELSLEKLVLKDIASVKF